MLLYLIRHGETGEAVRGLRQSYHARLHQGSVKLLQDKQDFKDIKFDKVYCSPQHRAKQTAQILFPGYKIEELDFIHEYMGPKSLEGKSLEKTWKFWQQFDKVQFYDPDFAPDGCESFRTILGRVKRLVDLLCQDNPSEAKVAVVGHSTFFKHTVGHILAGQYYTPNTFSDLLRQVKLGNGGYFKLEFDPQSQKGSLLELKW